MAAKSTPVVVSKPRTAAEYAAMAAALRGTPTEKSEDDGLILSTFVALGELGAAVVNGGTAARNAYTVNRALYKL